MFRPTLLRSLILASWLVFIVQGLAYRFYDPGLYALMKSISRVTLDVILNTHVIYNIILIIGLFFLIFSSSTLWLYYKIGKPTFFLYVIFSLISNYFVPVQTFNWIGLLCEDLSYFIMGLIFMALVTSPVKHQLTNDFHLKPFLFLYFGFLLVFVASRYYLFMF